MLNQHQQASPQVLPQGLIDQIYERKVTKTFQSWAAITDLKGSEQFLGMDYEFQANVRAKREKQLRELCKKEEVEYPNAKFHRGGLCLTDKKGKKSLLAYGSKAIRNIIASTAVEKAWARDTLMFAGTGQEYKSSLFWNFAFNPSTKTLVREVLSNQLLEFRQKYQEEYQ